MEMELKFKDNEEKAWFFISMLLASVLIMAIGCFFFAPSCSASVLVYGSNYNYSEVVLPNNSYVHQGENISQGYYYDLSGVYGWSGEVASWKNDYSTGKGAPDYIVNIATPRKVLIDPSIYPVGKWYQWDGVSCDTSGYCKNGFGNGNAYVFYVVPQATITEPVSTEVVTNSVITVLNENGTIEEIPVTSVTNIIVTQQTVEIENAQTIVIPTPSPVTPEITIIPEVTVKSSSGLEAPLLGIFAVCLFAIFARRD
jgi:hypothetical protein